MLCSVHRMWTLLCVCVCVCVCRTFSSCSMHPEWTTILQAAHFLRGADFLKEEIDTQHRGRLDSKHTTDTRTQEHNNAHRDVLEVPGHVSSWYSALTGPLHVYTCDESQCDDAMLLLRLQRSHNTKEPFKWIDRYFRCSMSFTPRVWWEDRYHAHLCPLEVKLQLRDG